jgi:hypothetical protein
MPAFVSTCELFKNSGWLSAKLARMATLTRTALMLITLILHASCTTPAKLGSQNRAALLNSVCSVGAPTHSVSGSVWIKVASSEITGQYPASVQVSDSTQEPHLQLEIHNLFGGVEATFKLRPHQYELTRGTSTHTEYGTLWNGIPMRWAIQLFLGRIPCPDLRETRIIPSDSETLVVLDQNQQKFSYTFSETHGVLRPSTLAWQNLEFKFDQFDSTSGSPKKWEARSPLGMLKVLWKERSSG